MTKSQSFSRPYARSGSRGAADCQSNGEPGRADAAVGVVDMVMADSTILGAPLVVIELGDAPASRRRTA